MIRLSAESLGVEFDEAAQLLSEIPSIRDFSWTMPVSAWLARHYPIVAKALFDKKPTEEALAIWKTQKYLNVGYATKKRSHSDEIAMGQVNRSRRKERAVAELKKGMRDRWAATDWKMVK